MSAGRRPDFQGNLEVLPMELVLQILSLARANGHLAFRSAGREGHIAFREGKVAALWQGRSRKPPRDLSVDEVMQRFATFLGWRSGTFLFRQREVFAGGDADLDVEGLLLEAMTRLDRARGGAVEDPGH